MIKNIVFDFGGVIVDIDRDKAVQAFIKLGLTDGRFMRTRAYYGRNQTGMAGLLQRSRFAQT